MMFITSGITIMTMMGEERGWEGEASGQPAGKQASSGFQYAERAE
jgi:hypothetical protein